MNNLVKSHPLRVSVQLLLAAVSFLLVAFGQPAWHLQMSLLASLFGYALFGRVLLSHPSKKKRFFLGMTWFTTVQLVQLSWFISHPYGYIYNVYFFLSLMMGIQFGILSLFIRPTENLKLSALSIAALWTIFEWSRLYFLSGFSFNPVGLTLTSHLYSLQMASIGGVLGLSFWVILTNIIALFTWVNPTKTRMILLVCLALCPYLYGFAQISYQELKIASKPINHFRAVLVQTAFDIEEEFVPLKQGTLERYVLGEWRQILTITKKHLKQPIDLIVLPEFVVPFGTYAFVYPLSDATNSFKEIFGEAILPLLPKAEWPLAFDLKTKDNVLIPHVNNAYFVQALANAFDSDVIAGLQDGEEIGDGKFEYYSGALLFHPSRSKNQKGLVQKELIIERYEKQVLVPMGEYIPFSFMNELAAKYGITGSFTCGKEAKIFACQGINISPSICYEETFGHIICKGKQKGADLLVNLTSDVWYPYSNLPKQHLDHARSRTVENGIPLIRACNTGITSAIDSLGRDIAVLGGTHPEDFEWVADSILVDVPLHHYKTLYSLWGDTPLIILCVFIILIHIGYCIKSRP